MKLLVDTCVFLWLMMDSKKISEPMLETLKNPENHRFLSAVSVWEIVVKWQLGKLKLPKPPVEFIAEAKQYGRFRELPLDDQSVLTLHKLPNLHHDPFDRMLLCQAIENSMTLVTPDTDITQYPVKTLWI